MKDDFENNEEAIEEPTENVMEVWHPLKFDVNEKYKYVPTNIFFRIISWIVYYIIAVPILSILLKLVYDFKIEGKENIKNLQGGAITVSNHVLVLDCAMVGLAVCGKKKIFYTTQSESFQIPFVRKLIKLLRAIPIPKGVKNKERMVKEISNLLKDNKFVHFYPEAILYPYCNKIRHFKNGAFDLAIKNDVPVVPIVIKFRQPKGIRKILKRKKDATLKILEPIYFENILKEESQENLDNNLKNNLENISKNNSKSNSKSNSNLEDTSNKTILSSREKAIILKDKVHEKMENEIINLV